MSPAPPGVPRRPVPPVPLERGRAAGMLAGLLTFGVGFAVAAVAVLAGHGGGVLYLVGVAVGFAGIGLVAVFLRRGTVPLPEAPIWSPTGLRALAVALQVPAPVLMVAVYGLVAFGFVGNLGSTVLR